MIIFVADTARDQEMLDKFQRAYENLKKIVDRLTSYVSRQKLLTYFSTLILFKNEKSEWNKNSGLIRKC